MKPGDVATCRECGARSEPASYSGGAWQEGWPFMVTWTNGPFARHELAGGSCHGEPEACAWCCDRARGFPALANRPLEREVPWLAGGPKLTFEVPPVGPGALGRALDRDGGTATATAPVSVPRPFSSAPDASGQLQLFAPRTGSGADRRAARERHAWAALNELITAAEEGRAPDASRVPNLPTMP